MSEEEIREYIISFAKDKRISSNILFNVFQASLKLFNTAGGTSYLSLWNFIPNEYLEDHAPNFVYNGQDMVCISY